ncbi:DUF6243 family protein [Streptomonospora nanhaiensis]|uniref:Uncharacterized protein n=1 Tax=Streptomonospora nanhaiensis TaxID=1323731 RepID=A0A853BGT5_9ACTN|nr:DUF6243 family protein [Streptomonospora nanhaiensis]MBV2364622.1 hypothetical protein [Streptomonospora nanhaiensis]MBX9388684.1 hypothetical protein [Streptomonospora nanhaiensis]NYI94688.1 hypothetical protein [Streptomonospora nanhaiensis]
MAKRHNSLLGIGGQRKHMSAEQPGSAPGRAGARSGAAAQKEELLRKMRERAQADRAAKDDEAERPAEDDTRA